MNSELKFKLEPGETVGERFEKLAQDWSEIGHLPEPQSIDYRLARRDLAFELFGALRFWTEPHTFGVDDGLFVVVGHNGSRSRATTLQEAQKLARDMHERSKGVACLCSICEKCSLN